MSVRIKFYQSWAVNSSPGIYHLVITGTVFTSLENTLKMANTGQLNFLNLK